VGGYQRVEGFVAAVHRGSQRVGGRGPDVAVRIICQKSHRRRNHLILWRSARSFHTAIASERMYRHQSHLWIVVPEVVHQLGDRVGIEEVVEDTAAARSNPGVVVLQAASDGRRRRHAGHHERAHRGLGTVLDSEVFYESVEIDLYSNHHAWLLQPCMYPRRAFSSDMRCPETCGH
jgi:hypothetical protein